MSVHFKRDVYIYTLSDPRTNEVRYVGASENPERRLLGHMQCDPCCGPAKWIEELIDAGFAPVLSVLRKVSAADGKAAEIDAIHQHEANGCRLTNVHHTLAARKGRRFELPAIPLDECVDDAPVAFDKHMAAFRARFRNMSDARFAELLRRDAARYELRGNVSALPKPRANMPKKKRHFVGV